MHLFANHSPKTSAAPPRSTACAFGTHLRGSEWVALLDPLPSSRSVRLFLCHLDRMGRGILDSTQSTTVERRQASKVLKALVGRLGIPPFEPLNRDEALVKVARGMLACQAAGKPLPKGMERARQEVAGLDEAETTACDVYVCVTCGRPLPAEQQLAVMERLLAGAEACIALGPCCSPAERNPANPSAHPGHSELFRGVVLATAGQLSHALHHVQEAAKFLPNDSDIHRVRGLILLRLERAQEATAALQQANRLGPPLPMDLSILLGMAQLDSGSPREAAQTLLKAVSMDR